ncbi:type II toxin-antitoxin system HicA family toxin [Acinetobacter pittii]|uniref:type II toxin-antitoxin system HicA family toxin n=1 Tax=Acinetobacter calcoaceticus/baumannii complex TaxID=909768 RepID=UPI00326156A5
MSKQQKLEARLRLRPKDFHWNEVVSLLTGKGFDCNESTSGSSTKFIHRESKIVIDIHKPHPNKILKMYQIKELISKLDELGIWESDICGDEEV